MKKYNLPIGFVLSLFISLMIFIPRTGRSTGDPAFAYAVTAFLYSFGCWFIIQLFINHTQPRNFWLCLFCSVALCIILTYARFLLARLMAWDMPEVISAGLSERQQLRVMFIRALLNNGLLMFVSYLLFLSEHAQKAQLEIARISRENLEARLFSLQQQISPHFLFNSLTTLRSLAPDTATKLYVEQLAAVYRYILTTNYAKLATLEAELEFTRAYLYILQERFESGLRITINIENHLLLRRIPPATLQILVENAIKHNIVSVDEPLLITLVNAGNSHLEVSNTLQLKRSAEEGTGIGLRNIQERYALLSDEDIVITKTPTHFAVKIPLLL